MKSRYERLGAILLSIAALTVCAGPSPMERVQLELQTGGDLYFVFGASALQRHVSDVYLALERGIAESSMPERDSIQSALMFLRVLTRLAGIREIATVGASSIRDAGLGFSNRVVIAAEPGSSGWLWKIHGVRASRLARIAELPADTAFAADFSVDLRPLCAAIRESGSEKWIARHCEQLPVHSATELLESLSGDWQIALAIPKNRQLDGNNPPFDELKKCDIYISAPDNRDSLKNMIGLLRTVNPAVKQLQNVTYVPNGDGSALVFVTLDHRMLFFSSIQSFDKFRDGSANVSANGKFISGAKPPETQNRRKRLADEPGIAAAMKRLPAESNGAYFSSDARIGGVLNIGGKDGFQLTLPNAADRSIGVLLIDDGMIVHRELSTEGLATGFFDAFIGNPLLYITDLAFRKRKHTSAPEKAKPLPGSGAGAVKKSASDVNVKRSAASVDQQEKCKKRLLEAKRFICEHTQKHGKMPPRLPASLKCGSAEYVYFAPFSVPPSGKMPLVADPLKGGAHPGIVNVLFVDGSIGTFELKTESVKRLCSYLYTIYRYDEKEFIQLIERASQLDAEKGK